MEARTAFASLTSKLGPLLTAFAPLLMRCMPEKMSEMETRRFTIGLRDILLSAGATPVRSQMVDVPQINTNGWLSEDYVQRAAEELLAAATAFDRPEMQGFIYSFLRTPNLRVIDILAAIEALPACRNAASNMLSSWNSDAGEPSDAQEFGRFLNALDVIETAPRIMHKCLGILLGACRSALKHRPYLVWRTDLVLERSRTLADAFASRLDGARLTLDDVSMLANEGTSIADATDLSPLVDVSFPTVAAFKFALDRVSPGLAARHRLAVTAKAQSGLPNPLKYDDRSNPLPMLDGSALGLGLSGASSTVAGLRQFADKDAILDFFQGMEDDQRRRISEDWRRRFDNAPDGVLDLLLDVSDIEKDLVEARKEELPKRAPQQIPGQMASRLDAGGALKWSFSTPGGRRSFREPDTTCRHALVLIDVFSAGLRVKQDGMHSFGGMGQWAALLGDTPLLAARELIVDAAKYGIEVGPDIAPALSHLVRNGYQDAVDALLPVLRIDSPMGWPSSLDEEVPQLKAWWALSEVEAGRLTLDTARLVISLLKSDNDGLRHRAALALHGEHCHLKNAHRTWRTSKVTYEVWEEIARQATDASATYVQRTILGWMLCNTVVDDLTTCEPGLFTEIGEIGCVRLKSL